MYTRWYINLQIYRLIHVSVSELPINVNEFLSIVDFCAPEASVDLNPSKLDIDVSALESPKELSSSGNTNRIKFVKNSWNYVIEASIHLRNLNHKYKRYVHNVCRNMLSKQRVPRLINTLIMRRLGN
jgi:hypothetical protein